MATWIRLTDGTGRRFNLNAARRFDSSYWFDGHNMVCGATGSQWDHEVLYRTARGTWVLHYRSDWQGVPDRWTTLSEHEAKAWLQRNNPSAWEELFQPAEEALIV